MIAIDYSEAIAKRLAPALRGAKATVRDEILNGQAQLWSLNGGQLVVVTRWEGLELVIVAAAGKGLAKVARQLYAYAVGNGAQSIRVHSTKPHVIASSLGQFPFQLVNKKRGLLMTEYIYRMEV